jgi:WD40 repeat protein
LRDCIFTGFKSLITDTSEGILIVWELHSCAIPREIARGPRDAISSITIDDDFTFIAVGFESGSVGLYEPTFTQPMKGFVAHCNSITVIAYSQLDGTLATAQRKSVS